MFCEMLFGVVSLGYNGLCGFSLDMRVPIWERALSLGEG